MRSILLSLMLAMPLVACNDGDGDTDSETDSDSGITGVFTGIETASGDVTLSIGSTQQLIINALYDDGSIQDVAAASTYRVINTSIASVGDTGLLTALAEGSTDIEVTYQGESTTFEAEVNTVAISGLVTFLGLPVADIAVHLSGETTDSAMTDETGAYSFDGLGGGDYTTAAVFPYADRVGNPGVDTTLNAVDATGVDIAITKAAYPIEPDGYESNNLPGAPTYLDVGVVQNHTLWSSPDGTIDAGDVDYFRVSLLANTRYDIFTAGLNGTADTKLFLYAVDGTTPITNGLDDAYADDFASFESLLVYTPTEDREVVFRVQSFDVESSSSVHQVADYFVGVVVHVDADNDDVPAFRDCDDGNASVSPLLAEIAGDGIDNNCSGSDVPAIDPGEPGNSNRANAIPLTLSEGSFAERTLLVGEGVVEATHTTGTNDHQDLDTYSVVVPAHTEYSVVVYGESVSSVFFYEADGSSSTFRLIGGETAETFYIEVTGTGDDTYDLSVFSLGEDVDGDEDYPRAWGSNRDCAEDDPSRDSSDCDAND